MTGLTCVTLYHKSWKGCGRQNHGQEMQIGLPLYDKQINVDLDVVCQRCKLESVETTNGKQFEQIFVYSNWPQKWLTCAKLAFGIFVYARL